MGACLHVAGISDTNSARVELTHNYIRSCDYIWVVAPISRVVDDTTVSQLLMRYAKVFKGMICVICTRSDDGIRGHEEPIIRDLKKQEQTVNPYFALTEDMKKKKIEISELKAKVTSARRRKKATKAQMLELREREDVLKVLKAEFDALQARRFAFIVETRNNLITSELQESKQSMLPNGTTLDVYCVSNNHYAAHRGVRLDGPRLTPENTGIPKLRADTLALAAPRLLRTLEHYANYTIQAMIKDLQLGLSKTPSSDRPELLKLANQPHENLAAQVNYRLATFVKEIQSLLDNNLQPAMPEAQQAAIKQLEKKKTKHSSTVLAFIRKDGKHSTKMCPKECWNEMFSKSFSDTIVKGEFSLSTSRAELTGALEQSVIDDLNNFKNAIEGMCISYFALGMVLIAL